jgi:hypothetical protein
VGETVADTVSASSFAGGVAHQSGSILMPLHITVFNCSSFCWFGVVDALAAAREVLLSV